MSDRDFKSERDFRQDVVAAWVTRCWGAECLQNIQERVARVLEEAVELAQAEGLSAEMAQRIVQHVYEKPAGTPEQEAAGVCVTMLAYGAAKRLSLQHVEAAEIDRVLSKPVEHFKTRHAEKAKAGIMPTRLGEAAHG